MIKICGFRISNYHNKVLIALLEKGVPFEEDCNVKPSQSPEYLALSPMGKVPFAEVNGARLSESEVILEYLEEAYPQKPLLPKDPLARAKVRELVTVIELHLELVARRLYGSAFFGGTASDSTKQSVEKDLAKGMRAFKALAKFDPFVAGAEFTLADCAAAVHLPLVSLSTKLTYGRDFLDELPQAKPYLKMLGALPSVAKVNADRKAAQEAAAAQAKK
ncbi:MAG TPA: glutathione S-transferase N-terminal domain-containing protein [Burkholderiales bacterium]|nr:glutathione S-transferase N-terminal domain-containing protein [Burkholderiales bacterium]